MESMTPDEVLAAYAAVRRRLEGLFADAEVADLRAALERVAVGAEQATQLRDG